MWERLIVILGIIGVILYNDNLEFVGKFVFNNKDNVWLILLVVFKIVIFIGIFCNLR